VYAEVTLVVEGAVEEEMFFYDGALLQGWIDNVDQEQQAEGWSGYLTVLWHDHPMGDCECVQYVQDHRPYKTWEGVAAAGDK
jgi:hypothetical protein